MTRVLPWKRTGAKASSSAAPRSSTTPIKADPGRKDNGSPAPSAASTKKRNGQSRVRRSGSTSPPPEPLQESFMIEGFDDDDRYHMVEDELLATARQFTAHLHAAEYVRLKEAAKDQNAAVISQIARPVVGGMSRLAEKKQERADLLRKQAAALRKGADSESDDDDVAPNSALKGTSLYTLMASPRKQVPRLDKIASFSKSTRAAAGFGASSSEMADSSRRPSIFSSSPIRRLGSVMDVEDEDSDDLDGSRRPPITKRTSNISSALSNLRGRNRPQTRDPVPTAGMKRPAPSTKTPSSSSAPVSQATQPSTGNMSDDSEDDLGGDPFGLKNRISQRNIRDRKRAKTTQQENSESTTSSSKDFIPGF
ncbi:hypothetical protein PG996_010553 [Apiospora saccharicola]|uniref:Uncharacterized protein n=1 Tax=Apiospora saccharicola TaxID=335842 RepID=A0ABR1UNY3_9PEZI